MQKMLTKIPPMTDKRSKYWDQPKTNEIIIDADVALMPNAVFDLLADYSGSMPSGIYAGKMWKARYQQGWELRWYSDAAEQGHFHMNRREIKVI